MDQLLSNKKHIAVFVLPSLIFFGLIAILPLIITGYYSLFDYDGMSKMMFVGLENYIKMLTDDKNFRTAFLNSLILVGASVGIQLPLAFLLALVLSKGVRGEGFFRAIYFIPVVISSMVIGRLWMSVFHSQYGLLNVLLRVLLGNPDFDFAWMIHPNTAFLTTVIPAVWQYVGYHMLIFYSGLKSIPNDYYEAAMIDGASSMKVMTKITIPLLSPVIKICMVFAVVGSIKSFDLVYIMTGGGPNNISHVPATLMYNNLFKRSLYGYGSAQAFFIVIACLFVSFLIAKLFKKAEENSVL